MSCIVCGKGEETALTRIVFEHPSLGLAHFRIEACATHAAWLAYKLGQAVCELREKVRDAAIPNPRLTPP